MQDLLGDVVARQIVPRLVRRLGSPEPTQDHEAELTGLVLSQDAVTAAAWARRLLARGMSFETLCLGVLAPASRRLGEMWLQDVCDFADVTLGTGRLQHVLHMLAPPLPAPSREGPRRQALLVAMPGEQHTFGLSILVHTFRMAGWDVASPGLETIDDLVALAARGGFGLVGLSVGSQERLGPVAGAIAAVRAAARPYGVRVMLGGPIFPEMPHLAAALGADLTAADAPSAVRAAETMMDRTATLQ
jgi:methanogenic corrinoid protein MtbC1